MEHEKAINVTLVCEDVQSQALKCFFLDFQSFFSLSKMGFKIFFLNVEENFSGGVVLLLWI